MFDALIIGGGVSSVSCALILGSAYKKPFAEDKKIGIIKHQKASSLQNAVFNNAYGIPKGKLGSELLIETTNQLKELYPHVEQIEGEKVLRIEKQTSGFLVETNKNKYTSKIVVIGIGSGNPFTFEGLENYIIPHKKAAPEKNRIQLKNEDHLVDEGIYAIGVLAGHRSQLSIAAGSGASAATDILTLWNDGKPVQVHDAVNK
ncbi:FAD-dependent oxidoreductase [Flavobacterium sp.]|uniref:FAD-dependent oxidoreductase n=1 Tax=Flavobacterium sp. TaxID=239 RepID=UPI003D2BABA9